MILNMICLISYLFLSLPLHLAWEENSVIEDQGAYNTNDPGATHAMGVKPGVETPPLGIGRS